MALTKMSMEGATDTPPLSVEEADTFLKRFLGLMGRSKLPQGHGLLLSPCSSVHMCFMRFSIDVVYLDEEGHILKIVPNLRPWIGLSLCPGARATLELAAGEVGRLGLQEGMRLKRVEG